MPTTPQACPAILIADCHACFTVAMSRLLSTDFKIVGIVHDVQALVQAALDLKPDIALIDVSLLNQEGFAVTKGIRRLLPDMIVVLHTFATDKLSAAPNSATEATDSTAECRELLRLSAAIKVILTGSRGRSVHPTLTVEPPFSPSLTERECEVLALLAGGCRMKEVGYRLGITYRTVTFHKYRAMRKLGVRSDSDLLRLTLRRNALESTPTAVDV